ncbi:hypothetical protein, partial [Burkholderia multivorans]|uniref:hypothetical protein n=1 Tax=Burkholderia multivorans TaxID=87883 RepID=UPI0021C128E0
GHALDVVQEPVTTTAVRHLTFELFSLKYQFVCFELQCSQIMAFGQIANGVEPLAPVLWFSNPGF